MFQYRKKIPISIIIIGIFLRVWAVNRSYPHTILRFIPAKLSKSAQLDFSKNLCYNKREWIKSGRKKQKKRVNSRSLVTFLLLAQLFKPKVPKNLSNTSSVLRILVAFLPTSAFRIARTSPAITSRSSSSQSSSLNPNAG